MISRAPTQPRVSAGADSSIRGILVPSLHGGGRGAGSAGGGSRLSRVFLGSVVSRGSVVYVGGPEEDIGGSDDLVEGDGGGVPPWDEERAQYDAAKRKSSDLKAPCSTDPV